MTQGTTAHNLTFWSPWALSCILPVMVYFLLPIDGKTMTQNMALFLAFTTWAVCLWSLELVNDTAVGLILPVLYVVFCGVKPQVAYAPWSSDVPNTVIGGFILCKVLSDTGLGKRIGLGCMKRMGGSFTGALWGITLAVFIVNPLIPAVTGKGVIFCAIVLSLCDTLEFKPQSREATALMLATFLAVACSKMCFLTGGGDLIIGMELVDKVLGTKTSWLEYAIWNFVPATLYTLMCVGLVVLVLPSQTDRNKLRDVLHQKYAELGPITTQQRHAAILLSIGLALLCTDSLHGVSTGMIMLGICFVAFLPKVELISTERLKSINFVPLFFIMGCMAIGSVGNALKVTNWIAANTLQYLEGWSLTWTAVGTYIVGVLGNFILTPLAATASMTSPITELGVQMGLEPRILYLSFKYGFDNYIFPYEYAVLLLFYGFGYMHFGSMVKVLAVRMVLTVPFIMFVAVPFWTWVM